MVKKILTSTSDCINSGIYDSFNLYMSKADGFDTTLATVILDGVNTDEAKLLIEIAYSMDRSIKENNFLLKNATIFVKN